MHAVLSFARLGEDRALEAPPQKLRDYFERIRTSGERLMLLLNDLLDLAKLEAGRMDLALQRVRLRVVTQEALREFEAALAAKRLRLDTALDDDGVVVGDPMRLGQVVRNLISNAVKFSPEGGTLRLSVATTELQVHSHSEALPHMPAMELRICDDGLGIPPAELDTIFESFTQSSQTKSSAGGTGLGFVDLQGNRHGPTAASSTPATATAAVPSSWSASPRPCADSPRTCPPSRTPLDSPMAYLKTLSTCGFPGTPPGG
ncbi:MAG: hypothetical protein IPO35_07895 [Uliginosibacterium sp.]|nr:hypothetical protein [Uliginosibacterium sp.]